MMPQRDGCVNILNNISMNIYIHINDTTPFNVETKEELAEYEK